MKLIATSVIRAAERGESHGGVYLVDFDTNKSRQILDWDKMGIEWDGRGGERGLRGIEFWNNNILLASSKAIYEFSQDWDVVNVYNNEHLHYCHEIDRINEDLYITSTKCDSILKLNLSKGEFTDGYHVKQEEVVEFDPQTRCDEVFKEPKFHINTVKGVEGGFYYSGSWSEGIYYYDGQFEKVARIPGLTHNAIPVQEGMIYNDTRKGMVVFKRKDGLSRSFTSVPVFDDMKNADLSDEIAMEGFARGLAFKDGKVFAGSSPATVSMYNLYSGDRIAMVNISKDVRNAIHGLEIWPY